MWQPRGWVSCLAVHRRCNPLHLPVAALALTVRTHCIFLLHLLPSLSSPQLPGDDWMNVDLTQLLTTEFLIHCNELLFPEKERCVRWIPYSSQTRYPPFHPTPPHRTTPHHTAPHHATTHYPNRQPYSTLFHTLHHRSTSKPPTKELSSDECIMLCSYLLAELTGDYSSFPEMPQWLRVCSINEAMVQVATDASNASKGIYVPRRFLLINDGTSGERGTHWFSFCYEVRIAMQPCPLL